MAPCTRTCNCHPVCCDSPQYNNITFESAQQYHVFNVEKKQEKQIEPENDAPENAVQNADAPAENVNAENAE